MRVKPNRVRETGGGWVSMRGDVCLVNGVSTCETREWVVARK